MRNVILVFNWKMNPVKKKEALDIFEKIGKSLKKNPGIKIIVAPPLIYLDCLNEYKKKWGLNLSAQDIFYKPDGAYTGSVSYKMIKNLGINYSIVGHWERKSCFYENNKEISKKINSLLSLKMKPIVCVGEEERDKDGKFIEKLKKEIKEIFQGVKKDDLKNIMVAYEPVWAIGKKDNKINFLDLEKGLILVKKILKDEFGGEAEKIKILYGGSVNKNNIEELKKMIALNGFLLGRSSLEEEEFSEIMRIIKNKK